MNHLTQVDPDPELEALRSFEPRVSRFHLALKIEGCLYCFGNARELAQDRISRLMDLLSTVPGDCLGKQIQAGIEALVGLFLVEAGEPAVSGDVRVED